MSEVSENELPPGWTEVPLSDVVDVLDSKRIPLNSDEREHRIKGKEQSDLVPYYGATGRVGFIDEALFEEPLILLGEDGVPFFDPLKHKAYRVTGKSWVNNHAHVLRAREAVADDRFLSAYLNSFDYTGYVTGSTRLKLTQGSMNSIPVRLAPLAEQKRIADKLEAVLGRVDACRARLDRVPDLLKRFRQSVLAAATSGQLTEEWNNEHSAGPWETMCVGDLCLNSFYGPRFGKEEYTTSDKGIPTVRTTDMTRDGRIEISSDTPRVLVSEKKLEHFRARKGDLLITRTGSIGVMAVFDQEIPVMPSAYLIRFRFSERVLPRYMFFCLMSPQGKESLGLSTTAVAQPNINAEAIKGIEISLPSIPEQEEIVRRVEALFAFADGIEASLTKARAQVERLTPATLSKAFRGELVPQDPHDEPASEMLARMRRTPLHNVKIPKTRNPKSLMRQQPFMPLPDLINELFGEKWFTFDDLRKKSKDRTYDELKDSLFDLLRPSEECRPSLKSRFNDKLEIMEFARIEA